MKFFFLTLKMFITKSGINLHGSQIENRKKTESLTWMSSTGIPALNHVSSSENGVTSRD